MTIYPHKNINIKSKRPFTIHLRNTTMIIYASIHKHACTAVKKNSNKNQLKRLSDAEW